MSLLVPSLFPGPGRPKAPPSRPTAWRQARSLGRSLGAMATRIAYGSGTSGSVRTQGFPGTEAS